MGGEPLERGMQRRSEADDDERAPVRFLVPKGEVLYMHGWAVPDPQRSSAFRRVDPGERSIWVPVEPTRTYQLTPDEMLAKLKELEARLIPPRASIMVPRQPAEPERAPMLAQPSPEGFPEKPPFEFKTDLARTLWELRQRNIIAGARLMTADEINEEIAQRRGQRPWSDAD